jgi:hypothetical protein
MDNYAELEISLFRLAPGEPGAGGFPTGTQDYLAELRFTDFSDPYRLPGVRTKVSVPYHILENLSAAEYGETLTGLLFDNPAIQGYLEPKRQILEQRDREKDTSTPLRLIVNIDEASPELHSLRWETLRDYRDQAWMVTKQSILFSRFLSTTSGLRPSLRPLRELTALVAVSNPLDLAEGRYRSGPPAGESLHVVDVTGEVRRAKQALAPAIPGDSQRLRVLARTENESRPVSLKNLVAAMSEGCDIFYLACHGAMLTMEGKANPVLLLEDDQTAKGTLTPASELVDRLRDLPANKLPRLVLLASCQSSGAGQTSDASSVLQAIGPQLAALGIPAVIAMQGKISMKTVEIFMPAFFSELLKHGQVDQALAVARGAVKDRLDAWMPVLYLGLKDGRLWYQAGFGAAEADFQLWPGILASIQTGQCLPVLGSGLAEFLTAPPGRLARAWAERYGYPLTENTVEELPQVAQYVAAQIGGSSAARIELLKFIKARLLENFARELPPDAPARPLKDLLPLLGAARRQADAQDPYYVLAKLPFPIYINTSPDNFLESALIEAGRTPQTLYFPWRADLQTRLENIRAAKALTPPDPDHPLLYYLFGTIQEPDSLVLTEDDYFDFIMWVNKTDAPAPIADPIQAAWNGSALLFLGFQLTDWNFRLLFRSILNGERRKARANAGFHSVAVQIPPTGELLSPAKARQYLGKYFPQGFDIYDGKPEDFLGQLWHEWQQRSVI